MTSKSPKRKNPLRSRVSSRARLKREAEAVTPEEHTIIAAEIADMPARPTTLADCPFLALLSRRQQYCPWVGCRLHLYLDVKANGSIRFNFPDHEVWEIPDTCAMLVAVTGEGALTNADVARILGISRERVRQIVRRLMVELYDRLEFRAMKAELRQISTYGGG